MDTTSAKRAAKKHRLGELGRAQDGVTAIEFAMVAPWLFMLLFGIIEFSLVMFASSVVEGATANAARLSRTGAERATAGSPAERAQADSNRLRQMILEQGGGLLKDEHLSIATLPETSQNGTMGVANEKVTYSVTYNWEVMTPFIGKLIAPPDGVYDIHSMAVVVNEPF